MNNPQDIILFKVLFKILFFQYATLENQFK